MNVRTYLWKPALLILHEFPEQECPPQIAQRIRDLQLSVSGDLLPVLVLNKDQPDAQMAPPYSPESGQLFSSSQMGEWIRHKLPAILKDRKVEEIILTGCCSDDSLENAIHVVSTAKIRLTIAKDAFWMPDQDDLKRKQLTSDNFQLTEYILERF